MQWSAVRMVGVTVQGTYCSVTGMTMLCMELMVKARDVSQACAMVSSEDGGDDCVGYVL